MLFLMVVCHQPLSEIQNLTIEEGFRLLNRFSVVLRKMFEGKNVNINVNGNVWIPDLTPDWEKGGSDHW